MRVRNLTAGQFGSRVALQSFKAATCLRGHYSFQRYRPHKTRVFSTRELIGHRHRIAALEHDIRRADLGLGDAGRIIEDAAGCLDNGNVG